MPKFKQSKSQKSLRFIPLGGAGHINRNMFAYECGKSIIIIDCGIGFPDSEMPGIDVTIPDISYLEKENRKKNVRGIVITHTHYDHFGALPYVLPRLPVPVYGSRLALEFIKKDLEDKGLPPKKDFFEIDLNRESFNLGEFKIHPFRMCHSVPDTLGFAIETPVGTIFHVTDYKVDWTPVDGKLFDIKKMSRLAAREKPLALVSDCLGANKKGSTISERGIQDTLEKEIKKAKGQVFITTISSNISRIKQAIAASLKNNRKICFLGRSIEKSAEIAIKLGYLKIAKKDVVHPKKAANLNHSQITYIAAGCYGQPNSAIGRLARGEHPFATIQKDARVIFSGDPAPAEAGPMVDKVVDRLILLGADVSYYEIQENMHVSGHGTAEDIKMVMGIIQPRFFIPIGGDPRHMHSYSLLAQSMGNPTQNIFELREGEFLEFEKSRKPQKGKFSFQNILVDGSGIGDVGKVVLQERQALSDDGIVVLVIPISPETGKISGPIEIVTRGFVYVKASKKLLSNLEKTVYSTVKSQASKRENWKRLKHQIENELSHHIERKIGRSPLVLPVIVEV